MGDLIEFPRRPIPLTPEQEFFAMLKERLAQERETEETPSDTGA
jgi:hypothetical protein